MGAASPEAVETMMWADAQEFEELDKASLGSIYFRKKKQRFMRQAPGNNTIQPQPLPPRKSKPTKTHIIEVQDFTRASIDRGPLHTTYSVRKNGQPLTSR